MKSILLSFVIFVCIFGGALLGRVFRSFLSDRHLDEESKHFVTTLGIELAGVMAAFVLALLVTGAQSNFHEQRNELIEMSAQIVFLDDILSSYGDETKETRALLSHDVARTLDEFWPTDGFRPALLEPDAAKGQALYNKILSLKPDSGAQSSLQAEALTLSFNIEQSLDLLIMQQNESIPVSFLIVLGLLLFWFVCIFFSLGIYAPMNTTVVLVLILSALSVVIAFFFIMDLNMPFEGILRMPAAPLKEALERIGR